VARVLVTGGTGTLGSRLVPVLLARGHTVRTLTRHGSAARRQDPASGEESLSHWRGDVATGEGLAQSMADCTVVVHTATSPRMSRAVEVGGTANVVAAATEASVHVIYISIVGVDAIDFAYYRAKRDAEDIVSSGPTPWTIQRATQFHDLIDRFLSWPLFPVTPHLRFQPVATEDVAVRLADLVDAGPSGHVENFGGPEVVALRTLASVRRGLVGSAAHLIPVPKLGPFRGFDAGYNLCPDRAMGRVTWEEWLRERRGPRQ
jgi:uncharacterized protein YbjT (DUF2867 family)